MAILIRVELQSVHDHIELVDSVLKFAGLAVGLLSVLIVDLLQPFIDRLLQGSDLVGNFNLHHAVQLLIIRIDFALQLPNLLLIGRQRLVLSL